MQQTEYKGSKYMALLEELRALGLGGTVFRVRYELSKKLGVTEGKHPPVKLSAEGFLQSLDMSKPYLGDVRRAYSSGNVDRAVAELIGHFRRRETPRFLFDWRDRVPYQRVLNERFADQVAGLVQQADEICQHEFPVFGSESVKFGDKIGWHLDPETGRSWPYAHWSRIGLRGKNRVGDVKFTWEFNRHQFFFTLGRAYWFTGDEKYAREFASLMRDWMSANPPEMGVNWYSNLEIALRIISWVWAYHFFLDSPHFDDELHFNFLRTILQSCRHIVGDFQYSRSMRNNHVIGDTAALAFAGIMFPEFEESRHWRSKYIDLLNRELHRQIHEDGTDFEQATSYHRFVLYFYVLLFRIMELNDYNIPEKSDRKVERMLEFLMYTMKPDGTMPLIGDCDDANVLSLSNDGSHDLSSILSTGAAVFRRGDFKRAAGRLSEETLWLCGTEGLDTYDSLKESNPPDLSRGFPQGGYYVMRTGWHPEAGYLLLKCGPQADHGHADALHIEMFSDGKSHLRDSGTFKYNGDLEWRTFFRSTRAHNTVVVDGESQSIPHRVFRWLKPAKSRTLRWVTSARFDYVEAEHYGYCRYNDPVTHRRGVFFAKPDYWVIVDRLMGKGEHSVELLFHIPSGDHELDDMSKIFRSENLAIIPLFPDGLAANIYEGSEKPIQGWLSGYYGEKSPAVTVSYAFTGKLPAIMATVLDPGHSVTNTEASVEGGRLSISVEADGFRDSLCFVDTDVSYVRENREIIP